MSRLHSLLISFAILICPKAFGQTVLFLGDSITAGYGVTKSESYPEVILQLLKPKYPELIVINGAESGSLSSSLVTRLEFYLKKTKPTHLVIASGGNDGRQLVTPETIKKNLTQTIGLAKKHKLKVLIAGMQIFPNLGKEYTDRFARVYPEISKKLNIGLMPFLLQAVAGITELNQADGFHPNPAGHKKIAVLLLPYLEKMLK